MYGNLYYCGCMEGFVRIFSHSCRTKLGFMLLSCDDVTQMLILFIIIIDRVPHDGSDSIDADELDDTLYICEKSISSADLEEDADRVMNTVRRPIRYVTYRRDSIFFIC